LLTHNSETDISEKSRSENEESKKGNSEKETYETRTILIRAD
jgi:hypothetical protein